LANQKPPLQAVLFNVLRIPEVATAGSNLGGAKRSWVSVVIGSFVAPFDK